MKKDKKQAEEIIDAQETMLDQEEVFNDNLQMKNMKLLADMENLRKRFAIEKEDALKYGAKDFIEEVLPSIDLFKSALNAENVSEEVKN